MSPAEKLAKRKPKSDWKRGAQVWWCGLREIRERLGLSLREVSKATGVNLSTLSRVEHGEELTLNNAVALSKFFGVGIEALWRPRQQ